MIGYPMNITPNKLTIAQLFATNNEQFVVPSYQRRYAWGYSQVGALFDDIQMLKDNDGHLFGMIILHTQLHVGGLNRPELVDGQQRLTTLTILLKAIQHCFVGLANQDKVDQIEKMLTCSGYDDVKIPKLELGELDNTDLTHLLKPNGSYSYTNPKIEEAYSNCCQWLEKLSPEDLNKFYFKLTNVAVIIRLDVGLPQEAYKLFETINNRGLRLSATDIIKNFLLGHASKISSDVLDDTKKLWSNIIMNLDAIDSDDFFRQYMCSLLHRKVSKSKLVYEFKHYYFKHVEKAELLGEFEYFVIDQDEDDENNGDESIVEDQSSEQTPPIRMSITELLDSMQKTSKTYRQIALLGFEEARINRHVGYLNKILSKPTYIFLMHLLQKELPESLKVQVLWTLECFMLRRHICEMRTGEHDDLFSKMMDIIDAGDILNEIKAQLKDDTPSDAAFKESFPGHHFKGKLTDRAKYVLEQVEYHEQGNAGELIIASGAEVELEHIIPQTISTKASKEEFGDWEKYLGPDSVAKHKKYVNLIGNMTLLADKLNIQAYNNPFAKKKGSYKKSSLMITKKLASQSQFKFRQVDKRGKALAEKSIKIWKF